jgi:hypothetical protein
MVKFYGIKPTTLPNRLTLLIIKEKKVTQKERAAESKKGTN